MKSTLKLWHLATVAVLAASSTTESQSRSCHDVQLQPPQLREQDVHVTLQLGYVRAEITQTLYNPNPASVEAVLHVPVPEAAAIAEVEIGDGRRTLRGEVLEVESADQLYRSANPAQSHAGLARLVENGDLEIRVAALKPESETQVRLVYYAPHVLHQGVGEYLYPARSSAELPGQELWPPQTEIQGAFRMTIDLRYAHPVDEINVPDFEGPVRITHVADDHVRVELTAEPGEATGMATVHYFINAPGEGSVDLMAHRPEASESGVFMMVLTPSDGFTARGREDAVPVLHFPGGRVSETTELDASRLSGGKEMIVFGRYNEAGRNRLILNEGVDWLQARHDTVVNFPSQDDQFPELERLWAHGRSRTLMAMSRQGFLTEEAALHEARTLGTRFQVLTPSHAMVLFEDASFEARGQLRPNAARIREERLAQSIRTSLPVWETRADLADAFFAPRGRTEGDCCFTNAVANNNARAYGLDLNPRPEVRLTVDPQPRYW